MELRWAMYRQSFRLLLLVVCAVLGLNPASMRNATKIATATPASNHIGGMACRVGSDDPAVAAECATVAFLRLVAAGFSSRVCVFSCSSYACGAGASGVTAAK